MIRDDIKSALVTAMKGGDKEGTATIRLIQSAIKNRDIELRTATQQPDDDQLVTEVLQKMIKQRRESVDLYRKGGREELAAFGTRFGTPDMFYRSFDLREYVEGEPPRDLRGARGALEPMQAALVSSQYEP